MWVTGPGHVAAVCSVAPPLAPPLLRTWGLCHIVTPRDKASEHLILSTRAFSCSFWFAGSSPFLSSASHTHSAFWSPRWLTGRLVSPRSCVVSLLATPSLAGPVNPAWSPAPCSSEMCSLTLPRPPWGFPTPATPALGSCFPDRTHRAGLERFVSAPVFLAGP